MSDDPGPDRTVDAIPLDAYRHGTVTPFDRLYRRRIVFLRGHFDDSRADELVAQLIALDAQDDEVVTLMIDSPGGAWQGMLAIRDVMASMRSAVHTRCVGLAGSAGAVLLASGTGTRTASPNARIGLCQPSGVAEGGGDDLERQAEQITLLRRRVEELLAARTGQPVGKIRADSEREFWMSAEEARDYGIVDGIA
jgi:ATP-dependent Clp protease, protease subunit